MYNYNINIFFSEEDEGYIADIPDLRFCSAFGETPLEALNELMVAQRLWMEEAKASGISIPQAKYKPVIYQIAQ
ncbi:MAG: type II toxin-antitoxin system HicB family antitoxin [Defluviitaleaceae bacterium]|nr:type II toxin-antitoxin system HicB family antitoxin [Defluviitaleaceae bacterium]MCL2239341.1 type II toxin-antitoxin system HicB family antitoxin [Defluviitaleaceae bacterium]